MWLVFFRCTTMLARFLDHCDAKNNGNVMFLGSKFMYCSGELWCNNVMHQLTLLPFSKSMFCFKKLERLENLAPLSQRWEIASMERLGMQFLDTCALWRVTPNRFWNLTILENLGIFRLLRIFILYERFMLIYFSIISRVKYNNQIITIAETVM